MLFVYYLHKSCTKAYNFFVKFFVYIKMVNKYYQKHKEILQKEACERHQKLSEEEKDRRWKMVRDRYKNLTKKKQKILFSTEKVTIWSF